MTDTNDGKLVRLDCLGRIRFSRAQREALLDGYESSGLSGPEFCARHGVKYQTFATWRQKRRHAKGHVRPKSDAPHSPPVFLLANVEAVPGPDDTVAGAKLEIHLPGGACLRVGPGETELAADLLKRLAGGGGC